MKRFLPIVLTVLATSLASSAVRAEETALSSIPAPTPGRDFNSCEHRSTAGDWTFGYDPAGCDVNPAQSSAFVSAQYAPVLYQEGVSNAHVKYMSAMFPVARDVGNYYVKRRNPKISAAELAGFMAGFYTFLQKETAWTHYRKSADSVIRYMRGDSLHGYGMVQLDDRSHATALDQGMGVDLIDNMLAGLDIYYTNWVASAKASCVSSSTDYVSRARSAWSAYNGGPGSICRWTRTTGTYASFDKDYYAIYKAKGWTKYVTNPNQLSALDIKCLAEGKRPCALLR